MKEIKRQIFHIILGVVILIILNLDITGIKYYLSFFLVIVMITGLILSFVSRTFKIPVISHFLKHFERFDNLKTFPGEGAFFYISGVLFSIIFFDIKIASASIAILAFGDSVSHLIGKYYGKTKMIIHPEKLLEGMVAGIISATLASSFFVKFKYAFTASLITMVLESCELKFLKLDDNFLIPIIAGIILSLIQKLF